MLELARKYFKPYRLFLILGPLAKVVEVVFDLLTPLVIAWMIDAGVLQKDISVLQKGTFLLLGFAFAGILFTLVTQKMASITSQGVGTKIRQSLFERVNQLSFLDLDSFGAPTLVTRITNDVNQVQVAVAMLIRQVIRWPILALGAIICALAINLSLGIVFLVCLPIIASVFFFVMKKQVVFFSQMQRRLDCIAQIAREGLSGTRVIRAFCREDYENARFKKASAAQVKSGMGAASLSVILNPATFLVINTSICVILWIGAREVGAGVLQAGQIMAFIGYMNQLLISIAYVANLVIIFTRAEASAKRINEVLDTVPSIDNGVGESVEKQRSLDPQSRALAQEAAQEEARIQETPAQEAALQIVLTPEAPLLSFQDVSFSFPGAQNNALSNISFKLDRGESLGIIGGTGSGKSTLANLVPRMYEATKGDVLFQGANVKTLAQPDLHAKIGFVPQHASLLSGTIRENLVWRDTHAPDEEIWSALEAAQAKDFVEAKEGKLEAEVSVDGKNFSGGQRQRLTVARALVGSPELVILDDAASALDFATDAALRRAIANLPNNPAAILISQRVATVRGADKILVLDKGRAVGYGTHAELVKDCPIYLEICRTQLREEEILA